MTLKCSKKFSCPKKTCWIPFSFFICGICSLRGSTWSRNHMFSKELISKGMKELDVIQEIKCVGTRVTHRSCIFTNVTLYTKSNTLKIGIYVPDNMNLLEVLKIRNIPGQCAFSGCGIVIPGPNPDRVNQREVVWQLQIEKKQTNFTTLNSKCFLDKPVVVWKQYRHNNFGHMIPDNLLALYVALLNLNNYYFNHELILVNDCFESEVWTEKSRNNCKRMQHMYYSLFHKVTYLKNKIQDGCSVINFSKLFIG